MWKQLLAIWYENNEYILIPTFSVEYSQELNVVDNLWTATLDETYQLKYYQQKILLHNHFHLEIAEVTLVITETCHAASGA